MPRRSFRGIPTNPPTAACATRILPISTTPRTSSAPRPWTTIVPAASGQPARSAAGFAADLQAHGLAADRIRVYPLAVRDEGGWAITTPGLREVTAWEQRERDEIRRAPGPQAAA